MNKQQKALFDAFKESYLARRIKQLENYIDSNEEIKELFAEVKDLQKKLVNAKHFDKLESYKVFKQEYDQKLKQLLDYPFLEEYFDLLEEMNGQLNLVCSTIEDEINEDLIEND